MMLMLMRDGCGSMMPSVMKMMCVKFSLVELRFRRGFFQRTVSAEALNQPLPGHRDDAKQLQIKRGIGEEMFRPGGLRQAD